MWANLRQALAFLTRFPACPDLADPVTSVPYFLPAGFVLGLFLSLAAFVVDSLFAVHAYHALLAAFLWLSLELWSTRALHWDGLADLSDALGSGAHGTRFLEIVRDSRLGSFGVIALILVLLGHFLVVSLHLAEQNYLMLVLAPAFARAMPVLLAQGLNANAGSCLGLMVVQALSRYPWLLAQTLAFVLLLPLLLVLFKSSWQVLLLYPLTAALLHALRSTARREGGISGDYCGAAIELAQLLFLFCTLGY